MHRNAVYMFCEPHVSAELRYERLSQVLTVPLLLARASVRYMTTKEAFIKHSVHFFQQVDFLWKKSLSRTLCHRSIHQADSVEKR